jgi:hypothetical protein
VAQVGLHLDQMQEQMAHMGLNICALYDRPEQMAHMEQNTKKPYTLDFASQMQNIFFFCNCEQFTATCSGHCSYIHLINLLFLSQHLSFSKIFSYYFSFTSLFSPNFIILFLSLHLFFPKS